MANAPIHTVLAYRAADGKEFLSLAEAQKHTRRNLHAGIRVAAIKTDTKYAHLDEDLLIDFMMDFDKQIAGVVADKLAPQALDQETLALHAKAFGLSLAGAAMPRAVGMPKELGMGYTPDPLKTESHAKDISKLANAASRPTSVKEVITEHELNMDEFEKDMNKAAAG